MFEIFNNALQWTLIAGAEVLKGSLSLVLPDLVGCAYMVCGAYVMLKALAGSKNILRPIAIVSGITIVALAVIA